MPGGRFGLFEPVLRWMRTVPKGVAQQSRKVLPKLRGLRTGVTNARTKAWRYVSRSTTRDPIDVASGEVVLRQVDIDLPGSLPLVLERTHVSSYREGALFGASWASTLDQRVEVDGSGVVFAAADGMILVYPPVTVPGVAVWPEEGPRWPLVLTEDGGYEVNDPQLRRTLHFPPGSAGTFRLGAISDRNGRRIDLLYGDDGQGSAPREIRHSGGYRIGVESDDAGRITAFRLLTGDGAVPLARFGYESGRLAYVTDASDRPLRFEYDAEERLTGWVDRNGGWYRYVYDEHGRGVRGFGADGYLDVRLAYGDGFTVVTDSLGNRTRFHLNERGQVVTKTDPLGHVTRSEWDRYDRLLARTDPLGGVARYAYDAMGNLTEVVRPDGARFTAAYDTLGLPTEVTGPEGEIWRQAYDECGNLIVSVDPLNATTSYRYDERGHLTDVTDPLGAVTRLMTDAAGLPVAVADPAGGTTRYTRDPFGRVSEVVDPVGGITRYRYTPEGRLATRSLPDGATERWFYDGEGNLVARTDAAGHTTRFEVTRFDVRSAQTGPDGARTEFTYDTELRLTAVTDPRGLVWRYEYDAGGHLIRETDFGGRTLTYVYDACGRLSERVNGLGETTRLTRDRLGNVTEVRTGAEVTTFAYDRAGRLVHAVNADADLLFERDVCGRVTAETCNGRTVSSRYDATGRRVWRRTPAGAEAAWRYDSAGRPAVLETAGRTLRFDHDTAGREVRRWIGETAVLDQQWDSSHRMRGQTLWGDRATRRPLMDRGYAYRADGLVRAISDDTFGTRDLTLDANGRVTAVQAPAWSERYAYDRVGDLVNATWPGAASAEATGEREYAGPLLHRAGEVRYEHDAQGRVVSSGGSGTWRYSWDGQDRLAAVITPLGHRWCYRYDPLGRRIAKQRLDSGGEVVEQTDFTWDGAVLAEQSEAVRADSKIVRRSLTWDCVPGGLRPLTQVERPTPGAGQEFHAVITDLTGAPAEMVDTTGNITWRSGATLWGVRPPDPTGRTTCPLRFPGQYHDAETGTLYNHRRYYDPATARYRSPDPLGLVPGPNPYAYSRHPLMFSDPFGLAAYTTMYRTSPKARGEDELKNGLNPDHFPRTPDGSLDGAAHFGNEKVAVDWARMHPDTHGTGFQVDVPDSWLRPRVDSGEIEVWEGFTEEHLEYVIPKELFGEFNAFQRRPWNGQVS
ncbi:DUF6531 domain-containing protein [Actinoallomurus sp. NPDC050550]|uniref:DUF6531 domain-containing protein n=1 Tax=Actinoallomurus sp. NPDC050550 TaxID=3154937 RepID=UPI00340116C7